MSPVHSPQRTHILGVAIDAVSASIALNTVLEWARAGESRYVCALNVHSLVTTFDDEAHLRSINESDLVIPDGHPVARYLSKRGYTEQRRVTGPDLMGDVCNSAVQEDLKIYLYGSTQEVLDKLRSVLEGRYVGIAIAGYYSPPFRELSDAERKQVSAKINESGANIVFVGLGCPKQEKWMAEMRGSVNAVMLGVGAAFDFYAGTSRRAPLWVRRIGMEWFFRMMSEPRRLFWRYMSTNTRYLWKLLLEKNN